MATVGPMRTLLAGVACCLAIAGCTRPLPDADVIIVGSGIAGLSAALEAGAAGRSVLVIDANSVGGGHAVKAGGFALVGTPLQERKGYRDSPEIAERDLLAWGEDADPEWVRRYVRASRTEVHDWLTAFGVRWGFILDTPEHSVPRFHFANGSFMPAAMMGLVAGMATSGGSPAASALTQRLDRAWDMVEARLGQSPYLAGADFTAADIMTLFPLTTMRLFAPRELGGYPNIAAYLQRIGAREAFQRAMTRADPGFVVPLT